MNDVLTQINTITRSLEAIYNRQFKQFELNKGQYLYLQLICNNAGSILEQLAEQAHVDKSTAARAIAKLEQQGLIEKRFEHANLKNKLLYPSPKGIAINAQIEQVINEYVNLCLSGISIREQQMLNDLLIVIEHNLNNN